MNARPSRRDDDEWEVYALSAGPLPRQIRAARRSLRVLRVGPIAVIARPVRDAEGTTEEALRVQHDVVVALADRIDPLLPARFGSRATAARLQATIRPSVEVLMDTLSHVRGRRQMTLRLIGPAAIGEPAGQDVTGTTYLRRRHAAVHDIPPEAAPFRAAVAPFVVDERMQPGRGQVRATLFHLVARNDVTKYRDAVKTVGAAAAGSPWRAEVSGPWPPFAFAPEILA